MPRQRIALISEHASPLAVLGGVDAGGQNVVVGELAQHLVTLGYDVDIFTRRDDDQLPDEVEWLDGVRVVHIRAGPPLPVAKEDILQYMPEFTDKILAFCEGSPSPYALVHAHFFMSGMAAADIKQMLGIPYVVTFHALGRVRRMHLGDEDGFPEVRLIIEQRVIDEADHIIALCPQDREDLLQLYGADPVKITVIPNGYNTDDFYPVEKMQARAALGLSPDEQIILQLGRLVPRKGIDTVIEALGILYHDMGVRAHLLIVGGDTDQPDPLTTPEIGRLQQVALEHDVAELVTFVGRRERSTLRYYYSAADIFVTTPWYEPFGMTPLESMACGTPVIGSRVGGLKYIIQDGHNGFLVPAQQPQALAERMAELLSAPELLARFEQNALADISKFKWAAVAEQTAALYKRMEDVV